MTLNCRIANTHTAPSSLGWSIFCSQINMYETQRRKEKERMEKLDLGLFQWMVIQFGNNVNIGDRRKRKPGDVAHYYSCH